MRENETNSLKKTKVLVGMAIFTAIVVVLQLIASFVKFGFFTPSLVLIPIVIGTAIYGIKAGAWLGFVFGVVVLIACITGADGGGYLMWGVNPAVTALICVGKGVACGALAGLTYQLLHHKNQILATVAAAVVCPVVNTGLFCLTVDVAEFLLAGRKLGRKRGRDRIGKEGVPVSGAVHTPAGVGVEVDIWLVHVVIGVLPHPKGPAGIERYA